MVSKFGVLELECPAQLTPIEHLWDELEYQMCTKGSRLTSVPNLMKALVAETLEILDEILPSIVKANFMEGVADLYRCDGQLSTLLPIYCMECVGVWTFGDVVAQRSRNWN